jgi:acetylornithine/succinyldiaminopimelate/putrescine aminotransferase
MFLSNRQLFLQHVAQTSPTPVGLEIVSASGVKMKDLNGKEYVDLISGISVSNVGHCHPAVVAAINKQAQTYMHLMVYGEYIQSPQVELAEAMTALLPQKLNSIFFVNSGSEATEGALKLAKRYTGRGELISFKNAYHGSTHGALSIMGSEVFKTNYRPLLPEVLNIEYNKEEDLKQITEKTACVVAEVVQSEAGVIAADIEYLKKLKARCHEVGAMLVFDEVQTGFGRTGSFFAFEQYGITPDILTLGKGMGGGMPIGAFVASYEMMQTLTVNPVLGHMTTFGGHPVCCAAALANLKVITEGKLYNRARNIEAIIREELKHPKIKEIRARGALIAVDFGSETECMATIHNCIEAGVVTDWFLFNPWSMRIAPPLTITDEELRDSCKVIMKSIA